MQLKPKNGDRHGAANICAILSAATCGLLMATPVTATEGAADQPWRLDLGGLNYVEKDRISVNGASIRLKRQIDENNSVSIRSTYDVVSGSSPTGAVKIQSRSGASGTGYLTKFDATRTSFGADWDTALGELTRLTLAADRSLQKTYESWGVGATLARDFNQRNTTLVVGLGYGKDLVKPEEGIHYGMGLVSENKVWSKDDKKEQLDLQLGLTQVISPSTLLQLNYIRSRGAGYMTNAYKIISVVNSETGSTGDYDALFENRPRVRDSNTIFTQLNQSVGNGVAYLSYRYFWDDWGIHSHMVDLKYRQPLGDNLYIQPHFRYYQQTAADFYRSMLTNTELANLPVYASADYRLARLRTNSLGVKVGYRPSFGGELSARVEVAFQSGEQRPWDAVGIQKNEGVFPTLNATMVHFGYTVPF